MRLCGDGDYANNGYAAAALVYSTLNLTSPPRGLPGSVSQSVIRRIHGAAHLWNSADVRSKNFHRDLFQEKAV